MSDTRIDLAAQFHQTMLRPGDNLKKEEKKEPPKTEQQEGEGKDAQKPDAPVTKPETPVLTKPEAQTTQKPAVTQQQQEKEQTQTRRLGEETEDFVPTTQQEDKTAEVARDLQGPLANLVKKQAFAPREAKIFSSEDSSQESAQAEETEQGAPAQAGQRKILRSQSQVSDFFMESWKEIAGEKQAPDMKLLDEEREEQQNIRQEQWAMPEKNKNLETHLKSLMAQETLHTIKTKTKEEKEGSSGVSQAVEDEEKEAGKTGKPGAGASSKGAGAKSAGGTDKKPAGQSGKADTPHYLAGDNRGFSSNLGNSPISPKIVSVRDKKETGVPSLGLGYSRQRREGLYSPTSSFDSLTTPKMGVSTFSAPGAPWKAPQQTQVNGAGKTVSDSMDFGTMPVKPGAIKPAESPRTKEVKPGEAPGIQGAQTGGTQVTRGTAPGDSGAVQAAKTAETPVTQGTKSADAPAQTKTDAGVTPKVSAEPVRPEAPKEQKTETIQEKRHQDPVADKALESKMKEMYDKIKDKPEAKGKFLGALEKRYKELGFSEEDIKKAKEETFKDEKSFKENVRVLLTKKDAQGKTGSEIKDKEGNNYIFDALPAAAKDVINWVGGIIPEGVKSVAKDVGNFVADTAKGAYNAVAGLFGGSSTTEEKKKTSDAPQDGKATPAQDTTAPERGRGTTQVSETKIKEETPQAATAQQTEPAKSEPKAKEESKAKEEPKPDAYKESAWYKQLSEEQKKKLDSSLDGIDARDRQRLDGSLTKLNQNERSQAIQWLDDAKAKDTIASKDKKPEEKATTASREKALDSIEVLSGAEKSVKDKAFSTINSVSPQDKAETVENVGKSLKGLEPADQEKLMKLLSAEGLKPEQRKDLLTASSQMYSSDRSKLVSRMSDMRAKDRSMIIDTISREQKGEDKGKVAENFVKSFEGLDQKEANALLGVLEKSKAEDRKGLLNATAGMTSTKENPDRQRFINQMSGGLTKEQQARVDRIISTTKDSEKSDVAGNISKSLETLTPAQRDRALSIIEGADEKERAQIAKNLSTSLGGVKPEDQEALLKMLERPEIANANDKKEVQKELLAITANVDPQDRKNFVDRMNSLKPEELKGTLDYMRNSAYYKAIQDDKTKGIKQASEKADALKLASIYQRGSLPGEKNLDIKEIDARIKATQDLVRDKGDGHQADRKGLIQKMVEGDPRVALDNMKFIKDPDKNTLGGRDSKGNLIPPGTKGPDGKPLPHKGITQLPKNPGPDAKPEEKAKYLEDLKKATEDRKTDVLTEAYSRQNFGNAVEIDKEYRDKFAGEYSEHLAADPKIGEEARKIAHDREKSAHFMHQNFSKEEIEEVQRGEVNLEDKIREKLINERVESAVSDRKELESALREMGKSPVEIEAIKKNHIRQITPEQANRMTAATINMNREARANPNHPLGNGHALLSAREISSVTFIKGEEPSFDGKTRSLTLPSHLLDKDPSEWSDKDKAMYAHETSHVAFKAALDPKNSGSEITAAFSSKVRAVFENMKDETYRENTLKAIRMTYEKLGYSPEAIEGIEREALRDPDEFLAHVATVRYTAENAQDKSVRETAREAEKLLPKDAVDLINKWQKDEIPKNREILMAATRAEIGDKADRFRGISEEYRNRLKGDKDLQKSFMTKTGKTEEDLKKLLESPDDFAREFKSLALNDDKAKREGFTKGDPKALPDDLNDKLSAWMTDGKVFAGGNYKQANEMLDYASRNKDQIQKSRDMLKEYRLDEVIRKNPDFLKNLEKLTRLTVDYDAKSEKLTQIQIDKFFASFTGETSSSDFGFLDFWGFDDETWAEFDKSWAKEDLDKGMDKFVSITDQIVIQNEHLFHLIGMHNVNEHNKGQHGHGDHGGAKTQNKTMMESTPMIATGGNRAIGGGTIGRGGYTPAQVGSNTPTQIGNNNARWGNETVTPGGWNRPGVVNQGTGYIPGQVIDPVITPKPYPDYPKPPYDWQKPPDTSWKDPEEKVEFSEKTQAVLDRKKAEAEAEVKKHEAIEQQKAEEVKQQEQAQVEQKKAEANKTWDGMKSLLTSSSPDSAHELAQLLLTRASTPDSAKEILKNFMTLLGRKDGQQQAANFLRMSSATPAGTDGLIKFLSVASKDSEGSAMAAKLLEAGSSHYDGASGLHQIMHSLSSQPEKAQEFARLMNQASNSPEGSASLAKTFQNLTKFPGGADNMAQFFRTASSTPQGGREMSQALANMTSTKGGAQAMANLFNNLSSQSPAALNNLLSSFSQMSSTKEGARFLSHAMANTANFPDTGKAMANFIQGASGTAEGTQSLFAAMKNMTASSDGARNVALFMERAASTPQGAESLSRALKSMTSNGQGVQDMVSIFSKAASSSQGSASLSQALLAMSNGRGNGEALLSFLQKASVTPRSAGEVSNLLSQLSSSPKGAENLSQLMARLSTSKDGNRILMQSFSNIASSPAGAKALGTTFMNMASMPQGSATMSQFLAKASSTPEGTRMLLATLSGMSSSSDGAHSVARFFEGASVTRQGAESLVTVMQNMSSSPQGVRDLTNLLLRASQSEDGGAALSNALANMSDARGGGDTIGKFLMSASSNPETGLSLARAMSQMASTEEGARSMAQFIAKSPMTAEGQQMALKAFGNIAQSPEGAQHLSKLLANVSKSGDGAEQLAAFLRNASSTPEGTSSLMTTMSKMMASQDGAKNVALFLARSSANPGGAQSIAGMLNNLSSSKEGLQQFLQLVGTSASNPTAGKAFAQALANLASSPGGAESISNLINSSLSSEAGTTALRQSLLAMTSTKEGALQISQFVNNYSATPDGARNLMEAFTKMSASPKGMSDIATLLERGTSTPEGAKMLNQALVNLSSSREGAEQLASLIAKTSTSNEGARALNHALVNIAYTGEGAANLGKVFQQLTSTSAGVQSMAAALKNLSSTREGAENVAIFLKNSSSSPEGLQSMQQSLLNLSSTPDGAESLSKFFSKASGSEFGGKALMDAFRGMTASPEGAHNLALLLQQTSSSPRGAMDFATFLRNAGDKPETSAEFARLLGEVSKDPQNVGALSRWIGNMNRTGEGKEALLEFFVKSSGSTEGSKSLAKLFDQASTNPELKRQLDTLIQESSANRKGASRVDTLLNNIDKGRREQVLSGTKSSEVAVTLRGEDSASKLKSDISASISQRPVIGRRGVDIEMEQKLLDIHSLEAQIKKAEVQMRASEKALNTSVMGEKGAALREAGSGGAQQGNVAGPGAASSDATQTAKMASAERDIARVAQLEDMKEAESTKKTRDLKRASAAPEEQEQAAEAREQKLPKFRPIDIYPESILRYLNICPQCGNKCNERDIFCIRCEAEYNRQIYMQSAVKFSRGGFYFRTHEDKLEFSGTAKNLFDQGEIDNEMAVLRRPPQYPKYQEFLAMSHS